MGKSLCPSLKGSLSGAQIRKSAVSHHRLFTNDGKGPNEEEFAKTMCHAVRTANKHLLQDPVKTNANIATSMKQMMTETETDRTSTEHPNSADRTSTTAPDPTDETPQIGKVTAWLTSAEVASIPSSWGSGRKMWSGKEEEMFVIATRFLLRKDIVNAIQFSAQQLRDKYKSMCR